MLRLQRIPRVYSRWDVWIEKCEIPFNLRKFIQLIIPVLICVHWMGCVWHFAGDISHKGDFGFSYKSSWLFGDDDDPQRVGNGIFSEYVISIYWSFTTITTVGYGDAANPTNDAERIIGVLCMSIGSVFYAYLLGEVCQLVAAMNKASLEYRETMEELNGTFACTCVCASQTSPEHL